MVRAWVLTNCRIFGMYLGIIQNQNMSRFVRFNAQQAILLDILLILPDVLTRLFAGMDGQGPTGVNRSPGGSDYVQLSVFVYLHLLPRRFCIRDVG